MPRVTEDYLTGKKNYILTCTGETLKEKPLYSVTIRDIIKEAGFNQGIIYHYHRSVDEIFVGYIDKNTTYHLLEQNIDLLLQSEGTETEILSECIITIGKYIEELLKSVGGKTCFELAVFYAYDIEKRAAIFPQLRFKQGLTYAQNKILEFVLNHIEKGIFYPQTPVQSMILFINNFIDGIAQNAAVGSARGEGISIMSQTLAKAVIGFSGVRHGTDGKKH